MIGYTCPACRAPFQIRRQGRCPSCRVLLYLSAVERDEGKDSVQPGWWWNPETQRWVEVGEHVRAV